MGFQALQLPSQVIELYTIFQSCVAFSNSGESAMRTKVKDPVPGRLLLVGSVTDTRAADDHQKWLDAVEAEAEAIETTIAEVMKDYRHITCRRRAGKGGAS